MKITSRSITDTAQIAGLVLERLKQRGAATIVALEGDLGSGKTAFTQEVGKILGVVENMHSPTFVIMKIYDISFRGFKKLIHIDAYRLEKEDELVNLGWEKITSDPTNLIFIEWPERVPGLIPADAVKISLKFVDEETREIYHEAEE